MRGQIFAAVFLSLLVSCVHQSSKSTLREPAEAPTYDQNLDYEKFLNIIKQPQTVTIEQALKQLSQSYAEDLSYHTFAYYSRSVQPATYMAPRTIVYGPYANFIFSFNGAAKAEGHNAIETISYDPVRLQYEFREIAFKKEPGTIDLSVQEKAFENENVVVSKVNPRKCLACHGDRPRPNWQPYFLWTGFYGSDNDFNHGVPSLGREVNVSSQDPNDSNEVKNWKVFNAKFRNQGRYKFLPPMNAQTVSHIVETAFPPISKDSVSYDDSSSEPNALFTALLQRQSFEQMTAQIFSSPSNKSLALSLFTILSCRPLDKSKLQDFLRKTIPLRLQRSLNPYQYNFDEVDHVYMEQVQNNFNELLLRNLLEDGKIIVFPDPIIYELTSTKEKNVLSKMLEKNPDFVQEAFSFQGNISTETPVIDRFLKASGPYGLRDFSYVLMRPPVFNDGYTTEESFRFFLRRELRSRYGSESWMNLVNETRPDNLWSSKVMVHCDELARISSRLLDADTNLK